MKCLCYTTQSSTLQKLHIIYFIYYFITNEAQTGRAWDTGLQMWSIVHKRWPLFVYHNANNNVYLSTGKNKIFSCRPLGQPILYSLYCMTRQHGLHRTVYKNLWLVTKITLVAERQVCIFEIDHRCMWCKFVPNEKGTTPSGQAVLPVYLPTQIFRMST